MGSRRDYDLCPITRARARRRRLAPARQQVLRTGRERRDAPAPGRRSDASTRTPWRLPDRPGGPVWQHRTGDRDAGTDGGARCGVVALVVGRHRPDVAVDARPAAVVVRRRPAPGPGPTRRLPAPGLPALRLRALVAAAAGPVASIIRRGLLGRPQPAPRRDRVRRDRRHRGGRVLRREARHGRSPLALEGAAAFFIFAPLYVLGLSLILLFGADIAYVDIGVHIPRAYVPFGVSPCAGPGRWSCRGSSPGCRSRRCCCA